MTHEYTKRAYAYRRLEHSRELRKQERIELLAGLALIVLSTAIAITPFVVVMLDYH